MTRRLVVVLLALTTRPGCTLGVARGGTPVYLRAYGMADLQHGLALAPHSIFHVASVSKQVAAVAVALLADDGKLCLDDDVRLFKRSPLTGSPVFG